MPIGIGLVFQFCGCGMGDSIVSPAGLRAFDDVATTSEERGGNDTFDRASRVEVSVDEPTWIRARLSSRNDVDIYAIGGGHAGDRLEVDVVGDSPLDAAAAVFDADGMLLYTNDDRHYFARQVDPRIDFVLPRDLDEIYVAVAVSPTSRSQGEYVVTLERTPEYEEVVKRPQTIVLNFDGALGISFGGRPAVDIPVFDASDISSHLARRSEEIIDHVTDLVRKDFVGLNVDILTTREQTEFPVDASYIHFGTHDPALLGVAENVDEFNRSPVQDAIIFTETFAVFNVIDPTIEQYAQALANVTSHEAGHLLGLVHTSDPVGVMDITASLRQLTSDQSFGQSPIEPSTFPMGIQDAVQLLVDGVGGDVRVARANADAQVGRHQKTIDADALPEAPRVPFTRCFCSTCEAKRAKQGGGGACGTGGVAVH